MRMLMNNLDPDVAEHPDALVVYGGTGPRRALLGCVRRDRRGAAELDRRRDAARPVGQAGRRLPHARMVAPRPDRQLQPRARVGDVGRVPAARGSSG